MIVQTADSFTICSTAGLLEEGDQPRAWAERHVRSDPDLKWLQGNYVEADQANLNGHTFPLAELLDAQHTLAGKPLNMLHREHYIVGAFAGAQLLTADGVEIGPGDVQDTKIAAAAAGRHPYIEAVAGLWHNRFPEEFFNIRKAHADGNLFFSMESRPDEVSCPTCGLRTAFAGLNSETYCADMQGATGPKILHRPVFGGGAIIIPPVKPGWSRADVTAIAKYIDTQPDQAEQVYEGVAAMAPQLDVSQWEAMMARIMASTFEARAFSPKQRQDMAKRGHAMSDGSFPIANRGDVSNAVQAIGRAKDPAAAKQHIIKRAKTLNCMDLIPAGWQ